ncbi:MAG TPA: ABC transporter permease [Terrimicrobiaceae bacterium]
MSTAILSIEEIQSAAPVKPSRARWNLGSLKRIVIRLVALAGFIGLWELTSNNKTHLVINFAHVPSPSMVVTAAVEFAQAPKSLRHITNSVRRVAIGFGLALVAAVPLGLLIGRSRLMEDVIMTPIEILRPIPGVAWIPLAILMFPTAEQSMIFICFLGAIFPILLSTIHGVESLDRKLIYAAQSLGAKTWPIFREVVFPGALPSVVTGLTIGMGTCWFLVVTAEMISGQFGIGYFTWESYTMQKYPDIIVGMLVIGVLGMASSAVVRFLGKRLMPWQRYQGTR